MTVLETDIVIHGQSGAVVAVVEIKNVPDLSRSYATGYLRNLAEHVSLPPAQFVVVLSQERAFVWKDVDDWTRPPPPALELDVKPVFDEYLREGGITGRLRGEELKTLAFDWLGRLTELDPYEYRDIERQLEDIGFLSAIRKALVTMVVV